MTHVAWQLGVVRGDVNLEGLAVATGDDHQAGAMIDEVVRRNPVGKFAAQTWKGQSTRRNRIDGTEPENGFRPSLPLQRAKGVVGDKLKPWDLLEKAASQHFARQLHEAQGAEYRCPTQGWHLALQELAKQQAVALEQESSAILATLLFFHEITGCRSGGEQMPVPGVRKRAAPPGKGRAARTRGARPAAWRRIANRTRFISNAKSVFDSLVQGRHGVIRQAPVPDAIPEAIRQFGRCQAGNALQCLKVVARLGIGEEARRIILHAFSALLIPSFLRFVEQIEVGLEAKGYAPFASSNPAQRGLTHELIELARGQ